MKKRLLGLALALVMVISLLPLTAIAEESPKPVPRFCVYDPSYTDNNNRYAVDVTFDAANTIYVGFVDIEGGNKPVLLSADPNDDDSYIKCDFDGVETLTITLHQIDYKRVGNCSYFFRATKDKEAEAGDGSEEYNVVIKLEGENKIESFSTASTANLPNIQLENHGDVTITGSGSLEANVVLQNKTSFISSTVGGNLTIKDTTITANLYSVGTTQHIGGITNNGSITIDNSTVNIVGQGQFSAPDTAKGRLYNICTGNKPSTASGDTNMGVTITSSEVTLTSGIYSPVTTNGRINIENSTVEMSKATTNNTPFASSIPYVTGCNTVEMLKVGNNGEYKAFDSFELAEGTALTATEQLVGFKAIHECAAQADDGDCTTAETCACGKEAIPAKQHTAGANNDCTKATPCANEGCTKDYAPAAATAHVAGQDDGDCTTDILCSNTGCTQVATKGAEKHVWDRANCDVAGACTNTGCTKTVEAGLHTGGTATCKDKAKCEECGKEYGELGACAPAADDGDCTTDIKCSVCGKTTTAGESAHKYTDKNDTTCDNAGCTNTRKVEGTENPKTGDNTAIAVMAALMVTAAAAFVTTKKFAR